MPGRTNWAEAIKPLLKKYKKEKHPLEYNNTYQLLIMVVLAAQDSDAHINNVVPAFFKAFPTMQVLAKATQEDLVPYIAKIRNSRNKMNWLLKIAQAVKTDSKIPLTMDGLTELPGIGRKSANVIRRESGLPPEGVIVDLHVVRVAPRLGIVKQTSDPKKIEQEIMEVLPQKEWDAGMAMSFHGRVICRPKPKCDECFMTEVCVYYKKNN